ncbi:10497_t:CDS:1, partial [Paraglomus brasilianum]
MSTITKQVSELKNAIKNELLQFENISPNKIKLWIVNISLEEENKKLDLIINKKADVNIKGK